MRRVKTWLRNRIAGPQPQDVFRRSWYQRHNQRRQEHLASLGLPLDHRTVLEVGAGIGDHTSFFIDRSCKVTTSDARPDNVAMLRVRYPDLDVRLLDLDDPDDTFDLEAEIVYCYGTLYHLSRPAEAIAFMQARCSGLLLLETCVSAGDDVSLNPVPEDIENVSQSLVGVGCRPTRPWVHQYLSKHFPHVYLARTQPWHPEFPLDWRDVDPHSSELVRAVFVASRAPLDDLKTLTTEIPYLQTRH